MACSIEDRFGVARGIFHIILKENLGRAVKVLAVSNALPTPQVEALGIFVWRELLGLRSQGIEVDEYRSTFRRAFAQSWKEFRRRIRATRPDLVNVYGGSVGALAVSLACPVPLVMTFGGPDLLGPATRDPLGERMVGVMAVALSHLAAPNADAIVVRSAELRGRLPRAADRHRAHVIAAGVDTEIFRPLDRAMARRQVNWDPTAQVLLFGGSRHRAVKRFDRAVAAVQRLNSMGVSVRLESCEQIAPDRMPIYLNAADCLLLTSEHEGSPNVVKEAASCGCPVVSVAVGDVADVLHGVSPSFVAEASSESLAYGLKEVLKSRRRSNGPDLMREKYSLTVTARRLRLLYDDVLAAWRKGVRHGWRHLHR